MHLANKPQTFTVNHRQGENLKTITTTTTTTHRRLSFPLDFVTFLNVHSILQFPNHFPTDNLIWSSKTKLPYEVNIQAVYLKTLKFRKKWLTRHHPIWNQVFCLQIVSFCYSRLLYAVLNKPYAGLGNWLGSVLTSYLTARPCFMQASLSSLSALPETQPSPCVASHCTYISVCHSTGWEPVLWPYSRSSPGPIKCTSVDSIWRGGNVL